MANTLLFLRHPDGELLTHGGKQLHRTFSIWVNGVYIEKFNDRSAGNYYYSGIALDDLINKRLATWEEALNCQTIRARSTFSLPTLLESAKAKRWKPDPQVTTKSEPARV